MNTITFFDWDDTLFPTSYLNKYKKDEQVKEIDKTQLEEFGKVILDTLVVANKHGRVNIVTNSDPGWIEKSLKRFIPDLLPYIATIPIIYSKYNHSKNYPDDPIEWKYQSFKRVLKNAKSVLSFGDQPADRFSLQRLKSNYPSILAKNIKITEAPKLIDLKSQLEHIVNIFESLYESKTAFDLKFKLEELEPLHNVNLPEIGALGRLKYSHSYNDLKILTSRKDLNINQQV